MKDLKYYPVRVSCVVLLELTDVYEVRTAS
jgi:hypothetical protein